MICAAWIKGKIRYLLSMYLSIYMIYILLRYLCYVYVHIQNEIKKANEKLEH